MKDMTDPLSPAEQEELLREAGSLLLSAAPEGWQGLELSFWSTVAVDTAEFPCTTASGEQVPLAPPTRVLRLFKKLRVGMHSGDRGAWFTARMAIQPPGRYQVDYDYDSGPVFVPPLTPDTFALDQEYFPRSEENTPEWLRQKLAEAAHNAEQY